MANADEFNVNLLADLRTELPSSQSLDHAEMMQPASSPDEANASAATDAVIDTLNDPPPIGDISTKKRRRDGPESSDALVDNGYYADADADDDDMTMDRVNDSHVSDDDDDDADHVDVGDDDDDDDDIDDALFNRSALPRWVLMQKSANESPLKVLEHLLSAFPSSARIPHTTLWSTALKLSLQLASALSQPMPFRRRLEHVSSLDDVVNLLRTSSNIVILTGAGISVSAGIPDFRSKGGIYRQLKDKYDMPEPECMFDLSYFRRNPHIFYSFAHELWPGSHLPTLSHHFISAIERRGKLLRNYTQNIDALEKSAGIQRILQCHGSFAMARCMTCGDRVDGMAIHESIMQQKIAYCIKCRPQHHQQQQAQTDDGATAQTTTDTDTELDTINPQSETLSDRAVSSTTHMPLPPPTSMLHGLMKPEIVFFGEQLPSTFDESIRSDRIVADLLIVMGSSLKVNPVASMIDAFPANVPAILINREVVGKPHQFDVELLGDCDVVCADLARRLEWDITPPIQSQQSLSAHQPATFTVVPLNRYLFSGAQTAPSPTPLDRRSPSDLDNGRHNEYHLRDDDEKIPRMIDPIREQRVIREMDEALTIDDDESQEINVITPRPRRRPDDDDESKTSISLVSPPSVPLVHELNRNTATHNTFSLHVN